MKMCIDLTLNQCNTYLILFLYIITSKETNYIVISYQSLENPFCRTINATGRDINPHYAQTIATSHQ